MARSFDGTDDYLQGSSCPLVGAGVFTVCFWMRALDNSRTNDYICAGVGATDSGAIIYEYVNNTVEFIGAIGSDPRPSSGLVVADTNWHHIAYRKAATGAAEWAKYLDGSKTVINASISFAMSSSATNFYLGRSGAGDYSNVELARFACWNSAVADAHIEEMAKGVNPIRFKPTHYWELMGNQSPELNVFGTIPLTVSGATKADHPRGIIAI